MLEWNRRPSPVAVVERHECEQPHSDMRVRQPAQSQECLVTEACRRERTSLRRQFPSLNSSSLSFLRTASSSAVTTGEAAMSRRVYG